MGVVIEGGGRRGGGGEGGVGKLFKKKTGGTLITDPRVLHMK